MDIDIDVDIDSGAPKRAPVYMRGVVWEFPNLEPNRGPKIVRLLL